MLPKIGTKVTKINQRKTNSFVSFLRIRKYDIKTIIRYAIPNLTIWSGPITFNAIII